MNRINDAIRELKILYEQGFSQPYRFQTEGVLDDPYGIYNGLGQHPEFLKIYYDLLALNKLERENIQKNAPWLFDPTLERIDNLSHQNQ